MQLIVKVAFYQIQLDKNPVPVSNFKERFGLLLDAEWISRKNNWLKRPIRKVSYVFPRV
jgi:hypothetical protein